MQDSLHVIFWNYKRLIIKRFGLIGRYEKVLISANI